MKALYSALNVIRGARRPYVALNLVYYGLIVCAMIYTAFDRSLQQTLTETVGGMFVEGPLASVWDAYSGGHVLLATTLTFVVNLVVGSFLSITLPSLVIPFSGLLVAGLRAVLWGLIFSPETLGASAGEVAAGFLIAVLLLLEGQGYVLAMLGAYVQGRAFLWPQRAGAAGRGQGYWLGVKQSAQIYLWVAVVLLVAAVYEVLIAVVVVPALL
jgi:hypothetical protein